MKKSFLQTFIVLVVLSMFVFNATGVVFAQTSYQQAQLQTVEEGDVSFFGLLAPAVGSGLYYGATRFLPEGNTLRQGADSTLSTVGSIAGAATAPFRWAANETAKLTIIPLIQTGAAFVLQLTQFVVYIAGGIFDLILTYTVNDQSFFLSIKSSIDSSWRIIRDLCNIFIVFSLLYLGIKTILQGNGFAETKTLVSIIVAAILINFSLMFTQVVFDVSNVIGKQISDQIIYTGQSTGYQGVRPYVFVGEKDGVTSIAEGLMGLVRPDMVVTALTTNTFTSDWIDLWNKVQTAVITGFILLFMIVIFVGASFLLMYRFIIFIVLMIASPVGITASFIPWFRDWGAKWWKALKTQAIVLPAFLLTFYIVMLFVQPISLRLTNIALTSGSLAQDGAANSLVTFIFYYLLIIGFLLLPLILPGKIGAAGAGMMTNVASWTTNKLRNAPKRIGQRAAQVGAGATARAGRTVLGGVVGTNIKDNAKLKRLAQSKDTGLKGFVKRTVGQTTLGAGDFLQNQSYDIRGLDAVKKSDFGKGLGKSINSWSKNVDERKKEFEKKSKKEMKLFGFDKLEDNPAVKASLQDAKAQRRTVDQEYTVISKEFDKATTDLKIAEKSSTGSAADVAKINTLKTLIDTKRKELLDKEKEVKGAEKLVGKLSNIGEFEYLKQLEGRFFGGGSSPKPTRQAAYYSYRKDQEKKWNKAGQSTKKRKDAAALSSGGTPSSPPASSPSSTPPSTP